MDQLATQHDEAARAEALRGAERMALKLLDAIEAAQFIRAGRTEREIELDIRALAKEKFGIEREWHKRIVRAGINTLSVAADNPPIRMVEDDDMVFLDLGPVFEEWEADVGRSYAAGNDPCKHTLCQELPRQLDAVKRHFESHPDITGSQLYAFACASAKEAVEVRRQHSWAHRCRIPARPHSGRQATPSRQPRKPGSDARSRCQWPGAPLDLGDPPGLAG